MDINYSNQIRNLTKVSLDKIDKITSFLNFNDLDQHTIFIRFFNSESKITRILKDCGLITEEDIRQKEVLKTMIFMQAYTDFYIMARYHNKIRKSDPNFYDVDYRMIVQFCHNQYVFDEMTKSMEEFKELSTFDKVLLIKDLTEKENEILKLNNPFYEYEKNLYDIEITKKFIMNQISKWEKSFDLDVALEQATKFIFKLNKINSLDVNQLFEELNIKGEKTFNDENIEFGGEYITKVILKSKLQEEYNSKKKIKK